MRKYDFTDHVNLGMDEINDRIENPVLKDGTVTVFKIVDVDGYESFRCAECLRRELFGEPSVIDPTGYFRKRVEQGSLGVVAVPQTNYDRGTSCSGCDKDILDFVPGDYGDDENAIEPDLYEDDEGYSDRHGEELDGEYTGEVQLQCPRCFSIDDMETMIVGWCRVDADGQHYTGDMENTERLDGGNTRCGDCGLVAPTSAFEGELKLYKIFERFERNSGSYYYGGTGDHVFIGDDYSPMQILGAVRAVREQNNKTLFRLRHKANRLTDKNIVIADENTGEVLFDLRYDYEGENDRPQDNNGLIQCGDCGHISRDSAWLEDDGTPVCPNCNKLGMARDYKGQEGRIGNIEGHFRVREVTYKADNSQHVPVEEYGRLLPVIGKTLGSISLVENASAMYVINQLNKLLRSSDKSPQGELRIVKAENVEKQFTTYTARTKDGSAALFFIEPDFD